MANTTTKKLSGEQRATLLDTLAARFEKNMKRHKGVTWAKVEAKIATKPDVLWTLSEMERTGGEPDVVVLGKKAGAYLFVDCSPESPSGRRSLCYDRAAWKARKEHKPKNTAMDVAEAIGISMLTEDQYRELQTLGEFDLKTSSWILTPTAVRKHGGAIFCDRRYDHVFTYHNGADSYYAARGFRGALSI
jgi:hypothetical protein